MNQCVKCGYSIPAGQEVWVRRKSTNAKVSLCANCAQEVRQARGSKRAPGGAQSASPPTPPFAGAAVDPIPMSGPSLASPTAGGAAAGSRQVIPVGGILLLLLFVLMGAPALGAIVAFVGRYLYLILLFPIATGLAGGYIVGQGVRWGKVRDSLVAAVFGLLLGVFAYGSYRYIDYRLARNEARDVVQEEMEAEFGLSDSGVADEIVDEFLLEETGHTGFVGMVLLDAQEGMSISRVGYGSDAGLNIGTTLTWVYWLFELGAFAVFPVFMAMESAGRPFCVYHDRWYKEEKSLGGVNTSRAEEVLGLLSGGEYLAFGKALNRKAPVPGVEFFIERCVGCQQSNPILTVKAVKRTSRGKIEHDVLGKQTLVPSQSEQIYEGVRAQS